MTKYLRTTFALLTALFLFSCSNTPLTGRSRLLLMPPGQLDQASEQQYKEVLKKSKVVKRSEQKKQLDRVAKNVTRSAEDFVRDHGLNMKFKWEVNLIDEDQVNAWAMPGGKIAFYTGILKYAQSDDEVAVVMGHEVAHVLAEHGRERISHEMLKTGLQIGADFAYFQNNPKYRTAFHVAFPIVTTVGFSLPYSRSHELEADEIGLILMAKAGYDPTAAVKFWQKMPGGSGEGLMKYLSTHPNHLQRIRELKRIMPKAYKIYQQNKGKTGR